MRDLFKRIRYLFFGDGAAPTVHEPEPLRSSERFMAYCCVIFLIAVAAYLPTRIFRDAAWYENRDDEVLKKCVIETGRFVWCYQRLSS